MKPKIFIIGFNKTGTRSFHNFFKHCGLPSVHWDGSHLVNCFERNIVLGKKLLADGVVQNRKVNTEGKYDDIVVFSDMSTANRPQDAIYYYKRLDRDYPNSKFILNIRDVESWIESRFKHGKGKAYQPHLEYFGLDDSESGRAILKQLYKKMHETHHKNVLEYFKNRKNDLLVFDIINDDIKKIIKFFKGTYELDAHRYIHKGKSASESNKIYSF